MHEFLQQARAAQLFSVSEDFHLYGVLESEVSADFGGLERLDMFFPFDPYLLQNSDRFLLLSLLITVFFLLRPLIEYCILSVLRQGLKSDQTY